LISDEIILNHATLFFMQGRVQSSVLSGTGPCNEGCEEFAEMFHLTMVRAVRWVISHLCLPLSHLFIWPAYSFAIFYSSFLPCIQSTTTPPCFT